MSRTFYSFFIFSNSRDLHPMNHKLRQLDIARRKMGISVGKSELLVLCAELAKKGLE